MNWVDWLILLMLTLGLINGLRQGLVRIVVGFGAMIVAFVAASWFHGFAAAYLATWIGEGVWASLGGYALVFLSIILAGSLVATLIVRFLGLIGLTPMDRILGGMLGVVRASVTLMIAAMLVMAFTPDRLPAAVRQSKLAPYVLRASDLISAATPNEIRSRVEETYAQVRTRVRKMRTPVPSFSGDR